MNILRNSLRSLCKGPGRKRRRRVVGGVAASHGFQSRPRPLHPSAVALCPLTPALLLLRWTGDGIGRLGHLLGHGRCCSHGCSRLHAGRHRRRRRWRPARGCRCQRRGGRGGCRTLLLLFLWAQEGMPAGLGWVARTADPAGKLQPPPPPPHPTHPTQPIPPHHTTAAATLASPACASLISSSRPPPLAAPCGSAESAPNERRRANWQQQRQRQRQQWRGPHLCSHRLWHCSGWRGSLLCLGLLSSHALLPCSHPLSLHAPCRRRSRLRCLCCCGRLRRCAAPGLRSGCDSGRRWRRRLGQRLLLDGRGAGGAAGGGARQASVKGAARRAE